MNVYKDKLNEKYTKEQSKLILENVEKEYTETLRCMSEVNKKLLKILFEKEELKYNQAL